jgi:hypothetical protein
MWIPSANLAPLNVSPHTRSSHERAMLESKVASDAMLEGYRDAHADLRCEFVGQKS